MGNNIKSLKTCLVWFRNDLRIHDHQPLLEACQKAETVIPLFCFDPRMFKNTCHGFLKTGGFRAKFLMESVENLRESFKSMGANLLVRTGIPEILIPEIAQSYQVQKVFAFKEVATEEIHLADILEQKLWKVGVSMNFFLGNTLYNKEDLPFPIKDIPDIYTNFRKRVEKDSFVRECYPVPTEIKVPLDVDWGVIPKLKDLEVVEKPFDEKSVLLFEGGETNGLHRLKDYIWETGAIKTYKQTRNGLLGSNYSTKLSSWLSLGCISPRKVYAEIKAYEETNGANDSTQCLINELLWRDYFRFVFKKYGSKLFLEKGLKADSPGYNLETQDDFFEKWKSGLTGIPFIDANMRELNSTGFMSNRGRQNVASFLVHDLKVKWILGAAYFEEKLIDYNPANNWGNWAYIAGVGNDPRENRYFNISKQAVDYDPKGEYMKKWIPELENVPSNLIHQLDMLSGNNYPPPIVSLKKFNP